MGIAVQSFVKRLPIIVGPLLGGLLIDRLGVERGVRTGLGISCVLAALALIAQVQIARETLPSSHSRQKFFALARQMDPSLRRLLLSDILIRFCERLPYAWIVIYAMDDIGVSATSVGVLTAVEVLTAMLCTVPAAWFADRYRREPFIIATFVFFTLFPLSLLFAQTLPLLVVAFFVRGLKEFGEPARKALIIGSCPTELRGRMIGSYYMIRDLIVAGGAIIGAALWTVGPRVNFSAAVILGITGTVYYVLTLPAKPVAAGEMSKRY